MERSLCQSVPPKKPHEVLLADGATVRLHVTLSDDVKAAVKFCLLRPLVDLVVPLAKPDFEIGLRP